MKPLNNSDTVKWWLMIAYFNYGAQECQVDIQVCDDVETALSKAKLAGNDEETKVRILCVVNSVPDYSRSLYRDSDGKWS